jgi:hypothetical protein
MLGDTLPTIHGLLVVHALCRRSPEASLRSPRLRRIVDTRTRVRFAALIRGASHWLLDVGSFRSRQHAILRASSRPSRCLDEFYRKRSRPGGAPKDQAAQPNETGHRLWPMGGTHFMFHGVPRGTLGETDILAPFAWMVSFYHPCPRPTWPAGLPTCPPAPWP